MGKIKLLQGNEACAEGALYAGCTFFAGYPITPSTEVAEYLARRLPLIRGVFIQMEDEIAAMAAVIGGSLAGRKSLTATSGPGFSLKQENIGFAALTDVVMTYLVDGYYNPADELGIAWNDPAVGADWGVTDPIMSDRDRGNPARADLPVGRRPYWPMRT